MPHPHTSLIKSLLTLADPITGQVNNISYSDLSELLTINKAPGRVDSGVPQKQTIRNYIKSIERECGNHFKIISQGQKLKFFFPDVPKLYQELIKELEVNIEEDTEPNTRKTKQSRGLTKERQAEDNTEINSDVNTEVNTPSSAVKNNIINIKTNITNKLEEKIFHPSAKKA